MNFKEYLNEMPQYVDHDYLDFKPIQDRPLQGLEKKWTRVDPYSKSDVIIFINKRKTMAILGKSIFNERDQSWDLEVATWIRLDPPYSPYSNPISQDHKRVTGVHTNEDYRLMKYTFELYMSLYKLGMRLESDNIQFQGAKPLWKRISRTIDVEVWDDEIKSVIYSKYDQRKIKDEEIWSKDKEHFLKTLRMK